MVNKEQSGSKVLRIIIGEESSIKSRSAISECILEIEGIEGWFQLHLVQRQYNEEFGALVSKAHVVPASLALRNADSNGEDIRVYYNSLTEFQILAEQFGIFQDLKVIFFILFRVHLKRSNPYFLC